MSSLWGRPQDLLPPQSLSSDQSPQSFSLSHFHLLGMQWPFSHWNWKYREQFGSSVGFSENKHTISRLPCTSVNIKLQIHSLLNTQVPGWPAHPSLPEKDKAASWTQWVTKNTSINSMEGHPPRPQLMFLWPTLLYILQMILEFLILMLYQRNDLTIDDNTMVTMMLLQCGIYYL